MFGQELELDEVGSGFTHTHTNTKHTQTHTPLLKPLSLDDIAPSAIKQGKEKLRSCNDGNIGGLSTLRKCFGCVHMV